MNKYHMSFRIYYEDTDAGGVVYHANYLKFAERARTEMLRSIGIEHNELAEKHKIMFAIFSINLDFIKPAKLDDLINIETTLLKLGGVRIEIYQTIGREKEDGTVENLVNVKVKIACVALNLKPARMPLTVKDALRKILES